MEQETILREILSTLKAYGKDTDQKFLNLEDSLEKKMNTNMDERINQFEKKFDDKMGQRFNQFEKKFDEKMDQRFNQFEKKMDKRFTQTEERLENRMDKGFASVNERIDQLGIKLDGTRVELTEVQETTDFLLKKVAQHEKKLRNL